MKDRSLCLVRLVTMSWANKTGLSMTKSLVPIQDDHGYFTMIKDALIGIEGQDVASLIVNINSLPDGVYELITTEDTYGRKIDTKYCFILKSLTSEFTYKTTRT